MPSNNVAGTIADVATVVSAVDPLILSIIQWIRGYQAASNGQWPDPALVTAAFQKDTMNLKELWAAWIPQSTSSPINNTAVNQVP